MHHIFKSHHPIRHAKSFKYAFEGIFHAMLNEPNFRVQMVVAITSIVMGIHFKIDTVEWALITITMGSLLSAEMINTVVEEVTDNFIAQISPTAKIIKDLSAGFVLVTAITTLTVLILIFGHRLMPLVF